MATHTPAKSLVGLCSCGDLEFLAFFAAVECCLSMLVSLCTLLMARGLESQTWEATTNNLGLSLHNFGAALRDTVAQLAVARIKAIPEQIRQPYTSR